MNSAKRLRRIRQGYFAPRNVSWDIMVQVNAAQLQIRDTLGSRLSLFMMGKPLYATSLKENWKKHPYTRRRGMTRTRSRSRSKQVIGAKR